MPNLATELERAIDRYGLLPHQLEVEITEGSLAQNPQHSRKQLKALRDVGVRIAMDDFGVGECSLSLLHTLELDT
ncbi:EAL domain-containing protein, partial [Undibacterium sp. 5I1]|uniref:EAL domain-containing protein n=1 Tax=Undibacterium sp. 5I1 TaxID=3048590 RepID=UPI002B222DB3